MPDCVPLMNHLSVIFSPANETYFTLLLRGMVPISPILEFVLRSPLQELNAPDHRRFSNGLDWLTIPATLGCTFRSLPYQMGPASFRAT